MEDERKTKKARFLIVFQKEAMIESFWRLEGGDVMSREMIGEMTQERGI